MLLATGFSCWMKKQEIRTESGTQSQVSFLKIERAQLCPPVSLNPSRSLGVSLGVLYLFFHFSHDKFDTCLGVGNICCACRRTQNQSSCGLVSLDMPCSMDKVMPRSCLFALRNFELECLVTPFLYIWALLGNPTVGLFQHGCRTPTSSVWFGNEDPAKVTHILCRQKRCIQCIPTIRSRTHFARQALFFISKCLPKWLQWRPAKKFSSIFLREMQAHEVPSASVFAGAS